MITGVKSRESLSVSTCTSFDNIPWHLIDPFLYNVRTRRENKILKDLLLNNSSSKFTQNALFGISLTRP